MRLVKGRQGTAGPLYGWSFAGIRALARIAAATAIAVPRPDPAGGYDAVFHGICEHLLTRDDAPDRRDLVRAGQDAVNALVLAGRHHRGYSRYPAPGDFRGPGAMPAFARY